ncbi:DNA-directed RNA polymerase II subunit RPB9 [Chaetomidium leptoderma]|uniref:DNA-directed RNA polymerase II subunit RPB9 n=1 Tax=Chaetomidium leptoderma TaxID=669021 RepID=A0AAN6ZZC4_9PEZI|nr:DNA-directed RNA polymerase II subunit RPB9 [Chaetomidium leptoderma]
MSSPAGSASDDRKKPAEQITFRFCSECSNMLYPKEDEVDRKLMFTCRTCNFSEEATSSCIFRNAMNNAAGETAGVTQDVGSDPTVGSDSLSSDAMDSGRRGSGSSGLSSSSTTSACISPCIGCGSMVVCETCGDHFSMRPSDRGTPELEHDEASILEFGRDVDLDDDEELDVDIDGVEIVPWTGETLDELAALMSQTEDFFGLRDVHLGMEEKVLVAAALKSQAVPTLLPRSKKTCPACQHDEAVFFQSQQRSAETGMVRSPVRRPEQPHKLFYVCCDCGNIFQ